MLKLEIPGVELFDEATQEFVNIEKVTVELEHSLVSLSKWERKFEKPFLSTPNKTTMESIGYVDAMCLTPGVPIETFMRLSDDNVTAINEYMDSKMTATWFNENIRERPSSEIVTADIIYYWMIGMNVPLECENWHLNRLFTLLRVINEKNKPAKKMSKAELAARNRELNEQRRKQYNTSG